MTVSVIETGFYPDVLFDEYCRLDAMNASTLVAGKKTMAHMRYRMLTPLEDTDALRLGRLTHLLVFEKEKFADQYILAPECDRRTKAGKATWAEFEVVALSSGREPVKSAHFDQAKQIADAVHDDPLARSIVTCRGHSEATLVWEDPDTGVLCKSRLDHLGDFNNYSVVSDLKTTDNAEEWAFKNAIQKYSYHIRAAFYMDGLKAVSGTERRWFWVVVEKTPPYCCAAYEPESELLDMGRSIYKDLLRRYKECKATDTWPGYSDDIEPIGAPGYAR